MGFAYGRNYFDWQLWYRNRGDLFAGVFWDMMDHPEGRLPQVG